MRLVGRPVVVIAAFAAAWLVVACLDVTSPISGIYSITRVLTATPSVVEHDSMRDTAGVVQPIRVYAFDASGDTVKDAIVRFYAIDTTNQLHVDTITGVVTGDTVAPNAAIFARVRPARGKGSIDTPPDTIPIVPVPLSAVRDTNFLFTFNPLASDSNSTELISPPFGVTVKGSADRPISKYPVTFELVAIPAKDSSADGPTVVPISALSTNDTTVGISDPSGRAVIRLRVRNKAISHPVFAGATDSAVIRLLVRVRGVPIPVTPSDTIVVRVQGKTS